MEKLSKEVNKSEFSTISLYLKNIKKPIKFEIPSQICEHRVNELYKELLIKDIIQFGPCVFQRSELIYLIVE